MTPACKENNAYSIYKKITSYLNQHAFSITLVVWHDSLRLCIGGKGWITQRNKFISISRVLTFSKVLFFIYLQIDCPEKKDGWATSTVITSSCSNSIDCQWQEYCSYRFLQNKKPCNSSGHKDLARNVRFVTGKRCCVRTLIRITELPH